MKKVLFVLCAALIAVSCFVVSKQAQAETAVQDQYCASGGNDSYEVLGQNGVNSQTFIPTKDRLSYINLKIGGIGLAGNTAITATILESFNGAVVGSKTVLPTITEPGVRQWAFTTPLTLETSKTYQIKLEKNGSGTVYWYYGVGDQTCDGNNRTYGFRDLTHQSWDFNYETFGFTYTAPPANDNANSSNSNTNAVTNSNTNSVAIPAGQSAGSGSTPATTTSTAIKAPSGLTVLYSNNAPNLNWSKSATADIDGYKIFRSETSTGNFTEIGKTVQTTLEYVDSADLVVGKTYYYFVRAYKTTAESASTTTVALLIPEATSETAANVENSITPVAIDAVDYTDYDTIQLYWILGWVVSVLLVLLVAYEIDQKRKGGLAGAKHFRLLK